LAAVRRPACDIGPPYFWRFSAVSGTGPLVVCEVVALAGWPWVWAEAAPVVVWSLGAAVLSAGAGIAPPDGVGDDEVEEPDMSEPLVPGALMPDEEPEVVSEVDGDVELDWAYAAPAISPQAATAPKR
jgi:hypothetical protein